MALRLDLKAGERFYVNGAIIEANHKASISLHNKAAFVRWTDLMHESEVTSPSKSLYFHVMKLALAQDDDGLHRAKVLGAATQLVHHYSDWEWGELLRDILELVQSGREYKALTRVKALIALETQRHLAAQAA